MPDGTPKLYNSFFYGILMHPKILTKVVGNDGAHLRYCPAVLLEHTRHKVKGYDFPGVIPYSASQTLFDRELSQEEKSVRGILVAGLTEKDIELLDRFEGSYYTRVPIAVHPLGDLDPLSEDPSIPSNPPPLPDISQLPPTIQAETYIFASINVLEPALWSFEDFVAKNAWKWY
ncbi:hypothetical protein FA15DRAFT_673596 [Coprinopsis marcescibilis]|uniref:Putative gamma-glutamylcyclotransferase n=1 Tax=Coprinopsis marcescibilis TaxID=230819 RepID=A0A5C3KJ33_COPMA|nr:hypothetical protein FA15DRAFT_673596 [Coprinopsis marcescibilis]